MSWVYNRLRDLDNCCIYGLHNSWTVSFFVCYENMSRVSYSGVTTNIPGFRSFILCVFFFLDCCSYFYHRFKLEPRFGSRLTSFVFPGFYFLSRSKISLPITSLGAGWSLYYSHYLSTGNVSWSSWIMVFTVCGFFLFQIPRFLPQPERLFFGATLIIPEHNLETNLRMDPRELIFSYFYFHFLNYNS